MYETLFNLSADDNVLILNDYHGQRGTHRRSDEQSDVIFTPGQLPFAQACIDGIWSDKWLSRRDDAFNTLGQLVRLMRVGSTLLISDYLLPTDERDSHYIRAFERLRHPQQPVGYTEYAWRGMVLDAGLRLEKVVTDSHLSRSPLLLPDQQYTPAQIERLHVLLLRAPDSTTRWLAPEYAGTDYATFQRHEITLVAQKIG